MRSWMGAPSHKAVNIIKKAVIESKVYNQFHRGGVLAFDVGLKLWVRVEGVISPRKTRWQKDIVANDEVYALAA